ncbi:MAG: hypothetical protein J2P21_12630 [Chloracidobacterium sp.]|nr:hypothetical protein [Chloracidobacterium sp.]
MRIKSPEACADDSLVSVVPSTDYRAYYNMLVIDARWLSRAPSKMIILLADLSTDIAKDLALSKYVYVFLSMEAWRIRGAQFRLAAGAASSLRS